MSKELQAAQNALAEFKETLPTTEDEYTKKQFITLKELLEQIRQLEQRDETTIEIARSFSFKLNAGNFESRDFFCSQKAECKWKDAEATSQALYDFCKNEVLKSVNQFRAVDTKKVKDAAKEESQLDAGN